MDKLISVEDLKDWIVGYQNAKQYNHPLNLRPKSISIEGLFTILKLMPDKSPDADIFDSRTIEKIRMNML